MNWLKKIKEFLSPKKTSETWNIKYNKKYKQLIYDPDGWNREDYEYSWSIEKITWEEFLRRAMRSTQIPID